MANFGSNLTVLKFNLHHNAQVQIFHMLFAIFNLHTTAPVKIFNLRIATTVDLTEDHEIRRIVL